MTVETLRNILGLMPPDMEVLIQQGEVDFDYIPALNVSRKIPVDWSVDDDDEKEFVVIDFCSSVQEVMGLPKYF